MENYLKKESLGQLGFKNLTTEYSVKKGCTNGKMVPGMDIEPLNSEYTVRRNGNHIYLYDIINPDTQYLVQQYIRDAVNDMVSEHAVEMAEGSLDESIILHIDSPGGYLQSGMYLYDFLKTSKVDITCIVEGICASAATLVFLGGKNKCLSPNSVFLMHELSYGDDGKNSYMQDLAVNAEKAMKRLVQIYETETKLYISKQDPKTGKEIPTLPAEREEMIRGFLSHDFELSAAECEKLGIVEPDDPNEDVQLEETDIAKIQEFIGKVANERMIANKKGEKDKKTPKVKKTPLTKKVSKKKVSKAKKIVPTKATPTK